MPSVGMRRSTRVFGARVLRSGRRLWTEPRKGSKYMRAPSGGNEWIDLLDNSVHGGGHAGDRYKSKRVGNVNVAVMDIDVESRQEEHASVETVEVRRLDRMFANVYTRKRKRAVSISSGLSEEERFGKKFARRRWRRTCWDAVSSNICSVLAIFATSSSYDSLCWISQFLSSVLRYMSKVRTEIPQLSSFLLSEPIFGSYSSHGIHFLQDVFMIKKPGFCIISGYSSSIPLFVLDFAAVPFCFMHLHTSLYLRSLYFSCLLYTHPSASEKDEIDLVNNVDVLLSSEISSAGDSTSQISPTGYIHFSGKLATEKNDSQPIELTGSFVGPKPAARSVELRKSRKIRKRRTSFWRKKRRPSSNHRSQKASETLLSEFLKIRKDGPQISAAASSRVLRSSNKKNSDADIREQSSTLSLLPLDISAASCSANLLIIETDKCYREEAVSINLQLSASKHWFLSVMKDGVKRYALTAHKVMRPPCFNRFTHATVWAADGGWKLEFPNKQDWLIFKELYKECSDRNVRIPVATVIPVPGVQEVSYPLNGNYIPYVRPESYIRVKDDELTRALMKNGANYDMDSEDEEWLKKFNVESLEQREHQELVTPERFELIIDALEKGSHFRRGDYFDPEAVDHVERKDVMEAIHTYWIKKRKQRRSALVKIFQLYQPRKTHIIPKSVPRRKRSFKRQSSQRQLSQSGRGKGKQITVLQALAAERDASEQRNKLEKVREAKAAADRSEEIAVVKRQRAQMLMENADLATYKAMMAVRIAEAAQVANAAPGTVASFLLVD